MVLTLRSLHPFHKLPLEASHVQLFLLEQNNVTFIRVASSYQSAGADVSLGGGSGNIFVSLKLDLATLSGVPAKVDHGCSNVSLRFRTTLQAVKSFLED